MAVSEEVKAARRAFAEAKASGDQQAIYRAAVALKSARENDSGGFGDYARAAAQGATFGFGDEIEAAARSLVSGTKYKDERDQIRAEMDTFREDNPVTALGLEAAGGMVTGGISGARALGAGFMRNAPTWARMAGIGALEGAAAGAGGANEMGDIPLSSVGGAGAGAILGAGGSKLGNMLTSRANKQQANALDFILQGDTPEEAARKVAEMGGTLADISDTARGAAAAAARSGAPRRQDYLDFLDTRQTGQQQRVANILSDEAGVRATRAQADEALKAARRTEADRLYGPLAGQPAVVSQDSIEMALKTPEGKSAVNNALKSLRLERRNPDLSIDDVAGEFDFWHRVQQAYREQAEGLMNPNKQGSSKMLGGGVSGERQKLMDEMVSGNPWGKQYQEATEAYRASSEVIAALKDGEKFKKIPTDELQKLVSGFTEDQKEAFTTGVVADLIDRTSRTVEDANAARNLIKSKDLRDRLGILLGDVRADRLIKRLQDESEKALTYQEVFRGSQTASRQAMGEILGNDVSPLGVAGNIMQGNFTDAGRAALSAIAPRQTVMQPAAAQSVLDVMQMTSPADIARALRALEAGAGTVPRYTIPGLTGAATNLLF